MNSRLLSLICNRSQVKRIETFTIRTKYLRSTLYAWNPVPSLIQKCMDTEHKARYVGKKEHFNTKKGRYVCSAIDPQEKCKKESHSACSNALIHGIFHGRKVTSSHSARNNKFEP